jgi:putative ABC transport system permease protein
MRTDRRLSWAYRLVRAAAPLVPSEIRDEWRAEWYAELHSLGDVNPRERRPIGRALGAFSDAFWLRQRGIADYAWINDVRQSVRQLFRHAGFALTAIGILALGLGATVTMFCVTDQILLRPIPYPNPDRIVTLWETRDRESALLDVSPGNLLDWRDRAQSFEHLVGIEPWSLDVTIGTTPQVWFAARVTEGFFQSFAVTPLHGRFFHRDEFTPGRDRVLVLSEAFWRRRFNGDPAIVGAQVLTNEGPHTIVGIVPATFEPRVLPTATGYREVWQPKVVEDYERNLRTSGFWAAVGRLKDGVELGTAQAEIDALSKQLAAEYPRTNEHTGGRVLPLRDHLVGNARLAVLLITAAAFSVLLIACVNVANLLLARGSSREREIAIRIAVGAKRSRVIRELLTESMVIAAIGGLVAAVLASSALEAIAAHATNCSSRSLNGPLAR